MNKIIILILCVFLLTGCQVSKDEKYIEKSKTYEIGEEKVVVEYKPEKAAYSETVLSGRTTSWGLNTRYEVGYGKDIEPGTYDIVSRGWASYNIFVDAVKLKFSTRSFGNYLFIDPLENAVCYAKEQNCMFSSSYAYYSRIEDMTLNEGTILYTEYQPSNSQGVSIRFEAQYVTIEHPKEEEIPEVRVDPLEVKESVRKYSDGYKCYINDYEVPDCNSLKYYDSLKKQF